MYNTVFPQNKNEECRDGIVSGIFLFELGIFSQRKGSFEKV